MRLGIEVLVSGAVLVLWFAVGARVLFSLDWLARFFALASILLSLAVNTLLKGCFRKRRAISSRSKVLYLGVQKYSFPSAHTQLAFTAFALIEGLYESLMLFSLGLALLTALSRLYLGRHDFRDVLAGGAIGYLTGKIGVILYGSFFLG